MSEHLVSDGYKFDNERDAMAWKVFVAKSTEYNYRDTEEIAETMAKQSYMYADAFLAERKRQQGEA